MSRTPPEVFELPVEKIRAGYYSDEYFNTTKSIITSGDLGFGPEVVMQVFQKKHAYLAGIDEAIAVLKLCNGKLTTGVGSKWQNHWDMLEIKALNEGDRISPYEPVMHIKGPYGLFAHLETVYLGVLSRRTLIATNVREVCDAANGKPIFFFPARHDHWAVQTGDGMAAYNVGGVAGVSTAAQGSWWGGKGMGTVPHALIAAFNGNTVDAARAFASKYGNQVNVTVLVDYWNTSAQTAVEVADALRDKLWGVRLDTSETLQDRVCRAGIEDGWLQGNQNGVSADLVKIVRRTLDRSDHQNVKIVASGGFTPTKIRDFEAQEVPVDAYGVGSSLIRGDNAFTADIVMVERKRQAKVGRSMRSNDRLELVT